MSHDQDQYPIIQSALETISAACSRADWIKIGAAVYSEWPGDQGFSLWDSWSRTAPDKYNERDARNTWHGFQQTGVRCDLGALVNEAKANGWQWPKAEQRSTNKGRNKQTPGKQKPANHTKQDKTNTAAKKNTPARTYPPAPELEGLFSLCGSVEGDPDAERWCAIRHLDVTALDEREDARVLPPYRLENAPRWMPSISTGKRKPRLPGRLLIPLYDHTGRPRSVKGRIVEQAVVKGISTVKMKSSPPVPPAPDHPGFKILGLAMMNQTAHELVTRPPDEVPLDVEVVIVEGEPDFLTRCQTTPGLAVFGIFSGSWKKPLAERIPDGAAVYIETDRDKDGDGYARKIADSLNGRCRLYRISPDAPQGDVNDLHVRGLLKQPSDMCTPYTPPVPPAPRTPPPGNKPDGNPPPEICHQWQLNYALQQVWNQLASRNKTILQRGHVARDQEPLFLAPTDAALARLVWRENPAHQQVLEIERMSLTHVMGLLTREFLWITFNDKGEKKNRDPKKSIGDQVFGDAANAPVSLPTLHTVTRTPIFGRDGTAIHTRGYHAAERLWYEPDEALRAMPPVPPTPSDAHVKRAREALLDAFCDFPFTGDAEQATAFAALLLPFVRRMIDGPTPIHLVEAPVQGSGKSLLAKIISIIVTGASPSPVVFNDNPEETQKTLAAELSRGRPMIVIDNVDTSRRPLRSPALSMVATETSPAFRRFGTNTEMMELPNYALWIMTGNNVKVDHDLVRRFVRCRLDPGDERPWMRPATVFKHPRLSSWTYENRVHLVWAALTLCQAWIAKGRQPGSKNLGSYGVWSATMSGILENAQIPGFLENAEAFYGMSDGEADAWPPFMLAWWKEHGSLSVTAKTLNKLCDEFSLMASTRGDKSELSQANRLGRALQSNHERVIEGLKLCGHRSSTTKNWEYHLEIAGQAPITTTEAAPEPGQCELGFTKGDDDEGC